MCFINFYIDIYFTTCILQFSLRVLIIFFRCNILHHRLLGQEGDRGWRYHTPSGSYKCVEGQERQVIDAHDNVITTRPTNSE